MQHTPPQTCGSKPGLPVVGAQLDEPCSIMLTIMPRDIETFTWKNLESKEPENSTLRSLKNDDDKPRNLLQIH